MSGTKKSLMERFISGVERIGNKLPHPFWIFTFLIVFVVGLSAVLASANFSVTYLAASKDPTVAPAMKTVAVKSLLSLEILNKYFGNFAGVYGGFYPIGIVLIMMMAIGLAEKSGFITAAMRKMILGAPVQWIIAIVAFVGINANLASDAGVVFTPLVAAAMLKSIGMNPWIGIIAGYAAANGGYTANFFIAGTDALLAGITESICTGNNISYPISPLMNWYFLSAAVVVLTAVTVLVTKYCTVPHIAADGLPIDIPRKECGDPESRTAIRLRTMAWAPAFPLRRGRKPPLIYHQKKGANGDGKSDIFLQIFFHSLDAAFHGTTDGAFIHALLASNLAVALSKDQMSVHPAALDLRQGVEGVPQPEEQLLAIHELLGAGLVQAGGVFDPIVTVQGIISLVVAHPFRMGGLTPLAGHEFLGYLVRHLHQFVR